MRKFLAALLVAALIAVPALASVWLIKHATLVAVVSIDNLTASSDTTAPTNATAVYQLESDGDIGGTNGSNTIVDRGDWITPKTNMGLYSVRASLVSGTLTSGFTDGVYRNLAATQGWTKTQSVNGTSSAQISIDIRRDSDSTVVDSATITLTATRNP